MDPIATIEKIFFQPHLISKSTDYKEQTPRYTRSSRGEKGDDVGELDKRTDAEVKKSVNSLRKLLREQTNLSVRSIQTLRDMREQTGKDDAVTASDNKADGVDKPRFPNIVVDVVASESEGGHLTGAHTKLDKSNGKKKTGGVFASMSKRHHTYSSNPNLGSHKHLKRSHTFGEHDKVNWKGRSVPGKLNLVSMLNEEQGKKEKKEHLPLLKHVDIFDEDMALEGVTQAHDYDFGQKEAAHQAAQKKAEEPEKLEDIIVSEDLITHAETEAKANWLLDEELKTAQKLFERRERALKIVLPEEDAMTVIEQRMSEIQHMAKPRRDERKALDRMPEDLRNRVIAVKAIPLDEIKREKRKTWKPKHRFIWGAEIIMLLLKSFRHRRKYYFEKSQMGALRKKMEKQVQSEQTHMPGRSSLGHEMRHSLTMQPRFRTKKDIKTVLWLLRATKAFKHLFPAEMETEVARHAAYEKYDDGRVLAYQSRYPDRFYYVIAGRVTLLRQFKLSTGHVTKVMGYLTKGMTTDPEEMEQQWMREDSLVARGQVEVLVLDKYAYNFLQHTNDGPPVEFLGSIPLFDNFPVDELKQHRDSVEYKYYGQGKIIVKDSNRTPWIHVIKSGAVKVVRRQDIVDSRASNEAKFTSPRVEELGCGKSFSHADTMIGTAGQQKKAKQTNGTKDGISLPQIGEGNNLTVDTVVNATMASGSHHSSVVTVVTGSSSHADTASNAESAEARSDASSNSGSPSKKNRVSIQLDDDDRTRAHGVETTADDSAATAGGGATEHPKARWGVKLPMLNIPTRQPEEEDPYNPHPVWLTREKTEAMANTPEHQYRRAYLILDELKPGDVFGLDHMQPALASDPHGVSLLSDGAEVVKISKRFFLAHAANNTMLKLETMYKEYCSEKEAQDMLYERETWSQYRRALWQRVSKRKGQRRRDIGKDNAINTARA